MRTTLNIPDPLFISAPNDGGLLYTHRHLLMPMLHEDATGLSLTRDGLLWCVQTPGNPLLREVRKGQIHTVTLADSPLDLHDVLVDDSDTYVVFTETNQVARLDGAFQIAESWSFGEERDSAHVNCVAVHHGRLLASMFGPFTSHRGYKGETRYAGRVIDVRSGETLIDGLSQPHSLIAAGDQLWLCSSEDRALKVYDREFHLKRELTLPGYTRGLAIGAHAVYVGLSRSRNLEVGEVGEFGTAVVAVLDRQTLSITGYLPLPWNEVYDIRIAPTADVVTDVMASIWAYERIQKNKEQEEKNKEQEDMWRRATERWERMQQQADEQLERVNQQAREQLEHIQRQAEEKLERAQQQWDRANQQIAEDLQLTQQHSLTMESAWKEAHEHAEAIQAQLTESRGETAKRDARIHALEQLRNELQLIKSSRSWRWTRWLRFMTRTIRHRGLSVEDRRKLFRGSAQTMTSGQPAAVTGNDDGNSETFMAARRSGLNAAPSPAAQADGKRDFFVFSVIDWHFRIQRPQHLARELAADGHRVFYLSNVFVDSDKPGFRLENLDENGRLFQIQLNLRGSPAIYHAPPTHDAQEMLRASIAELLSWSQTRGCVSMVQHPYWLETARMLPDHRLLYDCMDHHGGFADNTPEVLARERELMKVSDLLIVTSEWLHTEVGKYNPHRIKIRNACQYEHFADFQGEPFKDAKGRRVIGYYGAIAEWFDVELIEKVACRFSECLVLLIGADTIGAAKHLAHLPNVQFTGEVKYSQLPAYLAGFDVCLLPFRVIPLTLATNPVKIYEYLSAGKDVVSIDLPEIAQFGDLVRLGGDHTGFLNALGAALDTEPDASAIEARKAFAARQTWAHRGHDLIKGINAIEVPKVSVVVVTYNNLDLTKICLCSLDQYTDYPNLELIVVDNASADGSSDYLREWAAAGADRRVILNDDNRGFAAANNQGLAAASGDYLVMLNNDTHVTPGWVATLMAHLRRHDLLGMVGPVTNNIGNEARIEITYTDMEEMLEKAADYTRRHAGMSVPMRTAAFFCVMMPRCVYETVGPLDETFGIGFFEDDDYCRRVEQSGWSVACADDVFVHHQLSASFDKLKQEKRKELFEKNKALYESKWGEWIPHSYRNASSR